MFHVKSSNINKPSILKVDTCSTFESLVTIGLTTKTIIMEKVKVMDLQLGGFRHILLLMVNLWVSSTTSFIIDGELTFPGIISNADKSS